MPSSIKSDSTFVTLMVAVVLVAGLIAGVHYLPRYLGQAELAQGLAGGNGATRQTVAQNTQGTAVQRGQVWAASAPGRVEPKGGMVDVRPEASGRIVEVIGAVNDKVEAGDILVLLDDRDILTKLEAALAEVAVRLGERDEEEEKSALMLERRTADDAVDGAERSLHKVQLVLDRLYLAHRKGTAKADEVARARKALAVMKDYVASQKSERAKVLAKSGMPKPTRLDSGLAIARSELRSAELAYERTRVRATASGTLLSLDVLAGEIANPSDARALAQVGVLSELEVRAEVDERDVSKVFDGQSVVVRSNAYPGQDFTGKVVVIEPALGTPALKARGPRKPSDVDVLEVKVALDDNALLMPGMRVDVFFKKKAPVKAAAQRQ